jgi:hypothetical protein
MYVSQWMQIYVFEREESFQKRIHRDVQENRIQKISVCKHFPERGNTKASPITVFPGTVYLNWKPSFLTNTRWKWKDDTGQFRPLNLFYVFENWKRVDQEIHIAGSARISCRVILFSPRGSWAFILSQRTASASRIAVCWRQFASSNKSCAFFRSSFGFLHPYAVNHMRTCCSHWLSAPRKSHALIYLDHFLMANQGFPRRSCNVQILDLKLLA